MKHLRYDSPRQVRATIVTKGEFQDLLERTLCNESSSRFIQNGQFCHKTQIFHENDHANRIRKTGNMVGIKPAFHCQNRSFSWKIGVLWQTSPF